VEKIRRKLNSSSGITVVFALVGFLLATMVSFAIITAALNNVSRLRGQREEQVHYLAVTSAATLLRESLEDQTVTIVQHRDKENTAENEPREYSGGNALAQALADAMISGVFENQVLTLSVGTDDSLEMKVSTTYDGWRLKMVITPSSSDVKAPPMTLIFEGARATYSDVPVWGEESEYITVGEETVEIKVPVITGYTRTSTVVFPVNQARVEAKK
jgi:hypothetical protein